MTKRGRYIIIGAAVLVLIGLAIGVRACVTRPTPPLTIKSGETTKLGDVTWSVVSVLKTKDVGPSNSKIAAKEWFLVVDLFLTNNGKSAVKFDPDDFDLTDLKKRTYSIDKKATDAQLKGLANPKLMSIFSTTIPAGKKQRIVMVFPVREDSTQLVLRVSGDSVGADRDLRVELGF